MVRFLIGITVIVGLVSIGLGLGTLTYYVTGDSDLATTIGIGGLPAILFVILCAYAIGDVILG